MTNRTLKCSAEAGRGARIRGSGNSRLRSPRFEGDVFTKDAEKKPGAAIDFQLLVNAPQVGVDRATGDTQLAGDGLLPFSIEKPLDDLQFAAGEVQRAADRVQRVAVQRTRRLVLGPHLAVHVWSLVRHRASTSKRWRIVARTDELRQVRSRPC